MERKNRLFERFGVNSNEELLEFIKNNPEDPKSKEMIEMMKMFFGENFTLDMFEPGIEIEDNPSSDDMVYDCPDHSHDWMTSESEEKYGESL